MSSSTSATTDLEVVGRAYGQPVHAREVVAIDEAGDDRCWVRTSRHGDEWLLLRADPREVAAKVRRVRQIPRGASSSRFPIGTP